MSFEDRETSRIDLVNLIDPENRRLSLPGRNCQVPDRMPRDGDKRRQIYAAELTCALEAFQTYYMSFAQYQHFSRHFVDNNNQNDRHYQKAVNSLALAIKRNQIQDRIILRSDGLCSDFQRRLGLQLQVQNDSNFVNWVYNSRTRLLGGAGSLFLSSDAIFALTSAARITGLPGYINDEDQLETAVMEIAAEGIKLKRANDLKKINDRRFYRKGSTDPLTAPQLQQDAFSPLLKKSAIQGKSYQEIQKTIGVVSIGTYTLEQALSDVVDYHAACSVGAGLRAVAHRMETINRKN